VQDSSLRRNNPSIVEILCSFEKLNERTFTAIYEDLHVSVCGFAII
jgi:hypothetical protein